MESINVQTFKETFTADESYTSADQMQNVMGIIENVRKNKDAALLDYTEKFDGQKLDQIKVPTEYLKESYDKLDADIKSALELARDRITAYEESIKYQDKDLGEFSYIYRPLERAGIYVPGGTALYPSSVLMSVIPAQVAGVKEIHVTTPTFDRNNITFATLYLLGVDNVYTVGGAQAIAALAYGTETIPKVDKIAGPGNAYVAIAKRLVFGDGGIDSIAGPSEILLYVDDTADLDAVVYDVFAQAEHDPNARTFLLCEDEAFMKKIQARIPELLKDQPRKDIISQSLENNHYPIVDTRDNLLDVTNFIAAEHVSVQHKDEDAIVESINYAGAIFKGKTTCEAIGDYMAGPSHVLPTDQTARYSHGLNVNDFMTSHSVISLENDTYQDIVDAAAIIADYEGLYAHKASLLVRKEER